MVHTQKRNAVGVDISYHPHVFPPRRPDCWSYLPADFSVERHGEFPLGALRIRLHQHYPRMRGQCRFVIADVVDLLKDDRADLLHHLLYK